jgi:hypothetical protein
MDILAQLQAIAADDDFILRCNMLTEAWTEAGYGSDALDPILKFMEENPELDLGTPGPLVHFAEQFYRVPDYNGKLAASIERMPVPHTVWMLNRVLNAPDNVEEYEQLLVVMQSVRSNPRANEHTRQEAEDFLRFQSERG